MQKNGNEQQEYLGTGLSFPLEIGKRGQLKLETGVEKVKQSIYIILGTEIGERVDYPTFGCNLSKLAFAPLNDTTKKRICSCVKEALKTWEPRIVVEDVQTDDDSIQGRLNITISYQIKNYPDSYSLVYPFYLNSQPKQDEI